MPNRSRRQRRLRYAALAIVAAGFGTLALLWLREASYDPLAVARADRARGRIVNVLAHIPPQCYTRTDGRSNPCWTCHTARNNRNLADDWQLQARYAFNDMGRSNHWSGLFKDRRATISGTSDAAMLRYVREDNYTALRRALQREHDPQLRWVPDIDLRAGYDAQGFARDGSGWRAFRYKPFPGTFWPTNGSADDAAIRLPPAFRETADGQPSTAVYRANLAIVEAAVAVPDTRPDDALNYPIEPVDETAAGIDLDGDGRIAGMATRIRSLPAHYAGAAAGVAVHRYDYPVGTEFLHTVRYLDPDAPDFAAARLKELRYARKIFALSDQALQRHAVEDAREQDNGGWPYFGGDAFSGLFSQYGWQLQGYIEDPRGRLRLQTREEQVYCMGCHSGIGVTVDGTFSLPRKAPGAAGWGAQSLAGMKDWPQAGSTEPEILRYFERVGGGDEFRANDEVLSRYFPNGSLDRDAVLRASPDGPSDIRELILPSRQRALRLDKAYLDLVHTQDYIHGRDALPAPPLNVLRHVDAQTTGLDKAGRVYKDGRLWLDWSRPGQS